MYRQTSTVVFLLCFACLLLFCTVAPSTSAQSGTRKPRTSSKPPARTSSNNSATPLVISRFIKAMQNRDFKTVIDLIYSYQVEVSDIKSQNPRILWEKKVGEFYEKKISDLTEDASFWGDYFRGIGAMTGDPAQNLRAVAYLLSPSCKWHIVETRNEIITSVIEGESSQTTVYVAVDYPLDEFAPLVNQRFLKQTMLKFGVKPKTQGVTNVHQVIEMNAFWPKPYPKSATTFLVDKYKGDISRGDTTAINELIEIGGWEIVEAYLLEVIEEQAPYTKPFDAAINALADHRVQKAVPTIINALRGRNPIEVLVPGKGYWTTPDINLVIALQKIGKSGFDESTAILKERLSKLIGRNDNDWIKLHLAALASVDDEAWSTFPYQFKGVLSEITRKQLRASVFDSESMKSDKTTAFFNQLKPCNVGQGYRCPSELLFKSAKVLDARTMEIEGEIQGGWTYRKEGTFKLVIARKEGQMDKWFVREISRQN